MSGCRGRRRPVLVDPTIVGDAGFPLSTGADRRRSLTLDRHEDGCWEVVDDGPLRDQAIERRDQAIALASAVAGGLDVVGRIVTHLEFGDQVRWGGLRRSRLRQQSRACAIARREGGMGC